MFSVEFIRAIALLSLFFTSKAMETEGVERLTKVRVTLCELVGTEAETVDNIMELYKTNFDDSQGDLSKSTFLSDYLSKCSKIEIGMAVFNMLEVSSALIFRAVIAARFRNARHYKRTDDILTKGDTDHQMTHFCLDRLLELGAKDRSKKRFNQIIKHLLIKNDYVALKKFFDAGYPDFEYLYEVLVDIFNQPSFEAESFNDFCSHGALHDNFVMLAVLEAGRNDLACSGVNLGLKFPRRSKPCRYEDRNEIEPTILLKVTAISRRIALNKLSKAAGLVIMASQADFSSPFSTLPKELIIQHISSTMIDIVAEGIFHDIMAPEQYDSQ